MTRWLPAALALTLAALTAAATELEYTLSARAETRARSPLPGDHGAGPTSDVELQPSLTAALSAVPVRFELGYLPTLVIRDLGGDSPMLPLHRGRASLQWHRERFTARLGEDGAWGITDLGPLLTTDGSVTPGQVGSARVAGQVPYLRSASVLSLEGPLGAHVLLGGEASYLISGSTTSALLPLQWGPAALARLGWDATPLDRFKTATEFMHADFNTGHSQTLWELTETWNRKLSRPLSLEVMGGAAVIRQLLPIVTGGPLSGVYFDAQPVAGVMLTALVPLPAAVLELRGRTRLAPYADRFSALVYERLEAVASAQWVYRHELTLGCSGSGAWSFQETGSARVSDWLLAGEATAAWTATPWLLLAAAARAAHVEVPGPTTSFQNQWLIGVSATVREQERTTW